MRCLAWGNAILAAGIFKLYNSIKNVWHFDIFEGFTDAGIAPGEYDVIDSNKDEMKNAQELYYNTGYCGNSLDDVRANFERFGLLSENVKFIKGDVLKTLSNTNNIPPSISVLRLDTDMYDSTLMELNVLFPKLSIGGSIIIDDYGLYEGVHRAVNNYFSNINKPILQYIDNAARFGIKVKL